MLLDPRAFLLEKLALTRGNRPLNGWALKLGHELVEPRLVFRLGVGVRVAGAFVLDAVRQLSACAGGGRLGLVGDEGDGRSCGMEGRGLGCRRGGGSVHVAVACRRRGGRGSVHVGQILIPKGLSRLAATGETVTRDGDSLFLSLCFWAPGVAERGRPQSVGHCHLHGLCCCKTSPGDQHSDPA